MIELRPYRPNDLKDLYRISLSTGHAGGDASNLYKDPELLGHIYSTPYALLEPELSFVAVDGNGVAGFVVGTVDTAAWKIRLESEWWPGLRERYVRPNDVQRTDWTPDQRRIAMIFDPEQAPPHIISAYPAHLHLNVLPRLQNQGVGSRLLAA